MGFTKRQTKIIAILDRASGYTTVDALAAELQVSKRTLHNDLNAIIHASDSPIVEKKRGIGIRIQRQQSESRSADKSKETATILRIFKELLLDEQTVTIQGLADNYFVSQTSILKDLNTIRDEWLNESTVSLKSDAHGTRLVGNETQFRKTLIVFNEMVMELCGKKFQLENADVFCRFYPEELVDSCIDVVKSFESYHMFNIATHYELNVFHALLAMSYRMWKGYHLPSERNTLKLDEVMGLKNYLVAKDLLEMLAERISFSFTEDDIYGVSVYLQANRLEFKLSETYINETYHQVVVDIIRRMSECVHVDLTQDTTLYENAIAHFYHMAFRLKQGIHIRNPLLEDIKEEFRLMFDLTWIVLDEQCERVGIELNDDEVGFMMLHFQSALDKTMKSRKLLVVCPKGIVSSGFIVNRIRRVLPPLDIIESVSATSVERFDLDYVDLIISTIPLLDVNKPVVVVSPLITEKDLEAINHAYQEKLVLQEKETALVIKHLTPYIHPSYVFCSQEAQSMSEIVDCVAERLLADGYVRKGYKESVLEREANGGTELATGGAVPHGSLEFVNKTIIPVWINKTPVKWGKYYVKVIIFFVLAKNDLSHAKSLLEEIFKLVKSKQFINTKLLALSEKELLILLSGGEEID